MYSHVNILKPTELCILKMIILYYLNYFRDWIANIWKWIMEKAREFQKNNYFCFIVYAKAFDCVDLWKRWEYQTTWPTSRETCMQVRNQQLELDMEQQTGST